MILIPGTMLHMHLSSTRRVRAALHHYAPHLRAAREAVDMAVDIDAIHRKVEKTKKRLHTCGMCVQ
jgi:hypothetical protein